MFYGLLGYFQGFIGCVRLVSIGYGVWGGQLVFGESLVGEVVDQLLGCGRTEVFEEGEVQVQGVIYIKGGEFFCGGYQVFSELFCIFGAGYWGEVEVVRVQDGVRVMVQVFVEGGVVFY